MKPERIEELRQLLEAPTIATQTVQANRVLGNEDYALLCQMRDGLAEALNAIKAQDKDISTLKGMVFAMRQKAAVRDELLREIQEKIEWRPLHKDECRCSNCILRRKIDARLGGEGEDEDCD